MPLNEGYLAQNVRRLAGMHLASMEKLAQFVGISRPTMQAIVAHDPKQRSRPKAETAIKIAGAFAVPLNALYQEPVECLREAVEHFHEAPIAEFVEVPAVTIVDLIRASRELEDRLEAETKERAKERKRRR